MIQKKKIICATSKYIRMSGHKVRRILNNIKNLSYKEALIILELLPYRACEPIGQTLRSAAANAEHNYGKNKDLLFIEDAYVTEGPKLKRIRPRAQGRAYPIIKPTCHIRINVKEILK